MSLGVASVWKIPAKLERLRRSGNMSRVIKVPGRELVYFSRSLSQRYLDLITQAGRAAMKTEKPDLE